MASDDELRAYFKDLDTDGSGSLSMSEIDQLLKRNGYTYTQQEFQDLFRRLDTSGDGQISLDEYMSAMKSQPKPKHKSAVMRSVFQKWDKDGSGTIDKQELKQVFKELGKRFSEAELQQMIDMMDTDGDGSVDYEEFVKKVFGV